MGQKGAMRNRTEGGYAEWDRRGLCGMDRRGHGVPKPNLTHDKGMNNESVMYFTVLKIGARLNYFKLKIWCVIVRKLGADLSCF